MDIEKELKKIEIELDNIEKKLMVYQ